ncbi:MAG: DNA translocase FtsK [Ruminococcaceae bacterium]|nr:DNA translocase FtsK [Oscillospiraceae bacterium]
MANKKKKKATKNVEKPSKNQSAVNQFAAVIWFAVSILLLIITIFPGEKGWHSLHNFIFGMFGITSFLIPVFSICTCVIYSMGKFNGIYKLKTIIAGFLIYFIGAFADVIATNKASAYITHVSDVFLASTWKGGGALGAVFGNFLYQISTKGGAITILVIFLVAALMLLTGTSVAKLFRGARASVVAVSKKAEQTIADAKEEKEKEKKALTDISVDDMVDVDKLPLSPKQKRVVDTYNGVEVEAEPEVLEETSKSEPEVAKIKMTAEETAEEIATVAKEIDNTMEITEEESYAFPPISLLKEQKNENTSTVSAELESTANRLVEVLRSFSVETKLMDISRGPTVTRFELQPCAGVKISKITNLADDIALGLAAAGVRIEAPIPNKAAVGIEVPNKVCNTVTVREIIESAAFANSKSKLTVAMGRDIAGNPIVTDIAKMPHGLIAGQTGSGKSVCINSIIMSILYKAAPDEVKLLMIDPKVVELGIYNGIPHLLVPVVTDPRKASGALGWAVTEMERRYRLFADNNVRDIVGFNRLCELDSDLQKLPQIVIIIDELADLMITAPGEVEDSINRIAAKARAAGMHLLIATQRPSVDVVTGVIKANVPTRIAFAVAALVDSRTILDIGGAEKLLGRGDMLFNPVGASKPSRLQGCYVSDEEVEAVVEFVKGNRSSEYNEEIQGEIDRLAAAQKKGKGGMSDDSGDGDSEDDPMLSDAIRAVVEQGQASTSFLQRKLKLGYSRAARIMDQMEAKGVIGPYEGSKPRQILITSAELMEKEAREE